MELHLEDGSLKEIISCLNSEINVIMVKMTDECKDAIGEATTFATLDRTKGLEWPGDKTLEKLIPELPKVKITKVNKPDVTAKTREIDSPSLHRHHRRNKFYRKRVRKNNYSPTRRSNPPPKKARSDRSETSPVNDIDPWVCNPWETRPYFSQMDNTATASATSLISTTPFNDFYPPASASSPPFSTRTNSNNCNPPNNNTYEKNMRPTTSANVPLINGHLRHRNRQPPPIKMPIGPPFPLPNTFPQHPDVGFHGPAPNVSFSRPSLLGDAPGAARPGLLGRFPDTSFNRNLDMFANSVSGQSNSEGNTVTSLSRDEENMGNSSFTKTSSIVGSYDTSYDRIPRPNFDEYNDGNEISGQNSYESYEYPNNFDDSRNISFEDSEENYSRYHNNISSVNHYKEQYKDNYNHNLPKDNNKNIPLKSYDKIDYERFKKPPVRFQHSTSRYQKVGDDNLCENSYKGNKISNKSKTSFMNNQSRNSKEDSLIHISNSTVVYDPEHFQNYGCPADVSSSTSNVNLAPRSNRQNVKSNNIQRSGRQWTASNNYNYYRPNRAKRSQGRQRFRNRRTPQT